MAEQTREQQIAEAEKEQIRKLKDAIRKIGEKDSQFMFLVAKTTNPSASIYEIYFHANVVKKMGYNVIMLTDGEDYEVPYWIEDELTDLKHISMSNSNLSVSPQDVLIIPEIFSNAMEQTRNLPCVRVGLLQSVDYMINSLVPSTDWSSFGISKIITTSENLKDFMQEYYGKNTFDIKTYNIGIPSYFHNNTDKPKRPVVTVVGRNPNEISKLIKLFYAKYPQFSWLTFDSMITDSKPPRALRRPDYADRLRQNFASVWVDRIASFGTLPLEAMRSGSIPVALVPDITPEYLVETDENGEQSYVENSGVWTHDYYSLPVLLGDTLTKFLDDTIGDEVYEKMQEISGKYTQERAEEQLSTIYQSYMDERLNTLQKVVDDYENKQQEVLGEEK